MITLPPPRQSGGQLLGKKTGRIVLPKRQVPEAPVKGPSLLTRAVGFAERNFPGTQQQVAGISGDPLNLEPTKGGVRSFVDKFGKALDISPQIIRFAKAEYEKPILTKAFRVAGTEKITSPSDEFQQGLESVNAAIGLGFAPITGMIEAVNHLPIVGTITKTAMLPFSVGAEALSGVAGAAVDRVPTSVMSQEVKDKVKPGIQEVASLVGMLLTGKALHVGTKKIGELRSKYGEKEAGAIIGKAEQIVAERNKIDIKQVESPVSPETQKTIQLSPPDTGEIQSIVEPSQKQKVARAVFEQPLSIKEVAQQTEILEPNVRRILGTGAKEGTFTRVDKGVYTLSNAGKDLAYIEAGDAVEVLPRLVSEGRKYNSVILDPAYFSRALIGGNRGIKAYDFIHPENFKKVMDNVANLVEPDSPVYLMLSGARTATIDMAKYTKAAADAGFKLVGEGAYTKLFKDGSPVTNVRGEIAAPERIILLSKSGEIRPGEIPMDNLQFRFVRPSIAKSYATEKPVELMDALIRRGTIKGESILDPFAGSGVAGEAALKAGRVPTLIEKNPAVVSERIVPRIEKVAGSERVAPKTAPPVEAPPEAPRLPKGTGETVTPTLATKVEAKAIENKLTEGFGDLPSRQRFNMGDQATKAIEIIDRDYEQAKRIAMGTEAPPVDVFPESVFVALEERATKMGDVDTLRDLATKSNLTLEDSVLGARIRTLGERDPSSPVAAMEGVQAARVKAAERKLGAKKVKEVTTAETAKIKEKVKEAIIKKQSWADFAESIKC